MRRTAIALAWLAAAIVIALGAAGIVAALDHLPGGAGRPELTWAADRGVAPALDAASDELSGLVDAVGVLGDHGRSALAALVARDNAAVEREISAGTAQLDVVDAAAARVAAGLDLGTMSAPDRAIRYAPATIARYEALRSALPAVASIRPAWERLAGGVVPATELTRHLLAHDQIAGAAIQLGGAGRYRDAIARIDDASEELAAARTIRDRLAATVDVTTLDQWIARNAAYDDALRALWGALREAGERVTDAVREAAAREQAAKDLLPPDARALVVILGDVARGGLNQAVITIEDTRGRLLSAASSAEAPLAGTPIPEP